MPNNRRIPDWDLERGAQFLAVNALAAHHPPFIKGKTGEELFHLILSGIREVYDVSDVCVAGGAARDVAAGVTSHSDVDVFIPIEYKTFQAKFLELGWSGGLVPQAIRDYSNTKRQGNFRFKAKARALSVVQGTSVDLVFIEKPLTKENVDSFPIHAQRCVWSLDKGLFMSPEAKKDIENKTFTIDPTITDKDVIASLLEKINKWQKAGYKGWKVVEPDTKEWWEVKKSTEEANKSQLATWPKYFDTYDRKG
jgi:hypothetical protein